MENAAIFDVVVVGAGPAGLQAALHAARKKSAVVVLGRLQQSSLYNAHVENYLCMEGTQAGSELLAAGARQAQGFGARLCSEDVLKIVKKGDLFSVYSESGTEFLSFSLIFATGSTRKQLKVKGEKELAGRGVSYCVDCDINFFRGLPVAVVGNGSAAVDGALTLSCSASTVVLVAKKLEVSGELRRRLEKSPVLLREGVWPLAIEGERAVTGIRLDDGRTEAVEGVFIELGAKGAMELAQELGVTLDPENFTHIVVDRRQQTNVAGVFAAGDITGHPYQMAKAVGEGCVAGMEAATWARTRRQSVHP